jgi:hypothetical protein
MLNFPVSNPKILHKNGNVEIKAIRKNFSLNFNPQLTEMSNPTENRQKYLTQAAIAAEIGPEIRRNTVDPSMADQGQPSQFDIDRPQKPACNYLESMSQRRRHQAMPARPQQKRQTMAFDFASTLD